VSRVEEDVSLLGDDDRWHGDGERAFRAGPLAAVGARLVRPPGVVPVGRQLGEQGRLDERVGDLDGVDEGDGVEVVGVDVDEGLEQRERHGFAGGDDGNADAVPASGDSPRTLAAEGLGWGAAAGEAVQAHQV